MKPANIDLHIEELILRNLPYAQRQHIAAAVSRELQKLLTERGLPPSLAQGGYIPHINIDPIQVALDMQADVIGTQIAERVYGAIASREAQPSATSRNDRGSSIGTTPRSDRSLSRSH